MGGQSRNQQTDPLDEGDSGPGTVRILPEDAETVLMNPADAAAVNAHLQRGTLYTPAPAPPPSYSDTPLQASHDVQSQSLPRYETVQSSRTPDSQAIQLLEPEAGRLQRGEVGTLRPPQGNSPAPITKRGPSTCAILGVTFTVLLVSCSLLAFAGVGAGLDRLFGWIPNPFGTPKVVIDTSRPTIIESIRQQFKIISVEYHMEKIVTGTSTGVLPDWIIRDKLVLIAVGEVQAGVDMSKIKDGDIRVVSDTVRIRMPQAEILGQHLDEKQTQVFERDMTIFTRADPNLESQVRQVAVEKMVESAKENGILQKAQQNAEADMKLFLAALGYDNIIFETKP